MKNENIVDVDADADRVAEIMENVEVDIGRGESSLEDLVTDIQYAHSQLDEYKSGSLSLAQSLSEAADNVEDEVEEAILTDLSDGAFGVYLRLHRGDMELLGERSGRYSSFLTE